MTYMTVFMQQGPAETTGYMIAGYVFVFGIIALYLVSLFVRQRNLRQEMELLDEITASEKGSLSSPQDSRL
jgi:CcmD family protein